MLNLTVLLFHLVEPNSGAPLAPFTSIVRMSFNKFLVDFIKAQVRIVSMTLLEYLSHSQLNIEIKKNVYTIYYSNTYDSTSSDLKSVSMKLLPFKIFCLHWWSVRLCQHRKALKFRNVALSMKGMYTWHLHSHSEYDQNIFNLWSM